VPLDGALAASTTTPAAGEALYLYLNVTPRVYVAELHVRLTLPEGITPAAGVHLETIFRNVLPGRTMSFAARVQAATAAARRVVGTAAIADTGRLKLERAFVLDLNGHSAPAAKAAPGRDREGNPLLIYEGGR
jgi:hypothetical protein